MPTTLNQNGRKILIDDVSKLVRQLLSDDRRLEAESYSPALKNYLRVLEETLNAGQLNPSTQENVHSQLVLPRLAHWCEAALKSILNSEHPKQICADWSKVTDELLLKQFSRFFDSRFALISLGKWSSFELNLSSDIDLMIFSDAAEVDLKSLRNFQSCFEHSKNSFTTYRLDFDLRPGGRMGPMISRLEQAQDYYFNFGQTWERVALFRFRCLNNDFVQFESLNNFRTKFCFRKHLDYSVLQDLRKIRKLMQSKRQKAKNTELDLKFAFGGIRDIELYLHSLVIIHGGKVQSMRAMPIDEIINNAVQLKLLNKTDAELIQNTYWDLRRLENLAQAIEDQQTHLLDLNATWPAWVATILLDLNTRMSQINKIVEEILGEPHQVLAEIENAPKDSLLNEILELKVLSRNRTEDESERLKFISTFLAEGSNTESPALRRLRDFIKSTRAKASFFSFLNQHPQLIQDLFWVFSNSEFLSQILIGKPELLDTYWLNSMPTPPKEPEDLLSWLLEKKLLSELKMGSALLHGAEPLEIAKDYSKLMRSLLVELSKLVLEHEKSGLNVLMMGKLATYEMGFRSDLDLVFIADEDRIEEHTKLARRFISRLTEPQRGGRLAQVDLRLRPSGNSGPLVVTKLNLKKYLAEDAAIWERMAYLRSDLLHTENNFEIKKEILLRGLSDSDMEELKKIRLRILSEHSEFSLKYSEGGVLDIELSLQTLCLSRKIQCESFSVEEMLEKACAQEQRLLQNYHALRKAEMLWQIIENQTSSKSHEILVTNQALAEALKLPLSELNSHFQRLLSDNVQILSKIDPRRLHS